MLRGRLIFTFIALVTIIVALTGSFNTAISGGDAEAGKKIFDAQCSICHGATGKGDGPTGVYLTPKPADLSDATFMASKSDEELSETIKNGKGVVMPPFGKLSDDDRANVLAHIRSFALGK